MKLLESYTQEFQTSRPIFHLHFSGGSGRIYLDAAEPETKFQPTPIEGDVLSELVCSHFYETFNVSRGEFTLDRYDIADRAMNDIRSAMSTFLEQNMDMKNPRQSKLYKWYSRNLPKGYDFNDMLVSLYRYMRSFCTAEMRSNETKHVKSTIALMEAIMEKYENQ